MPQKLNNILIIKPSSMGDVVLALPALSALRKAFPDARISWFVRPDFAPLLEGHPYLDEIVHFDRKFLGRAWHSPKAFSALIALMRRLRNARYDAVFDFQGLFRTASLGWLSGAPLRLGMASTREPTRLFYTHRISKTEQTVHLVDYYLDIVKAAGVTVADVEFVLPEDEQAASSVASLLKQNDVDPQDYVVLVPSSAHDDKCWPIDRFAQLADTIRDQFSAPVVAVGSPSERELAEQLNNRSQSGVINLAGRTSLRQLVALLRPARLVVSNDTGAGHIAAAWGTPVVMIFGRTNPARVAPYGKPECAAAIDPFGRGMIIDSPDPRHHVNNVTFDQVHQKVRTILES
jgi:lipopolysaccharide heptosyltransferase I